MKHMLALYLAVAVSMAQAAEPDQAQIDHFSQEIGLSYGGLLSKALPGMERELYKPLFTKFYFLDIPLHIISCRKESCLAYKEDDGKMIVNLHREPNDHDGESVSGRFVEVLTPDYARSLRLRRL